MSFFQEFREFGKSILPWLYFFLAFSVFFFVLGLKEIEIFGKNLLLPLPTINSFSAQFFERIQQDLVPNGVQLIVTNPLSAFLAQVLVSLLMAFICTFPLFLYKMISYLSPALFEHEKKAVLKVLIPSTFLFVSGCLFAYFILIPLTFKILYLYTGAMGVIPFFSVNEFVTLVLGFIIAVGIMFLLPVFMALLSYSRIVEADTWKKNWRYSILIFLMFSAIITPDGSGMTMLLLSLPLAGLYFLGWFISSKNLKTNKSKKGRTLLNLK